MSVKVDLVRFQKKVLAKVDKLTAKKLMNELAREAIKLMKKRIRSGRGVREDLDNTYFFPKLSREYIERRRRLRLSPFTSPGKSNITQTGKLVASLRYVTRTGNAEIKPTGRRSNGLSNIELAEILLKKDRIFMNLSNNEARKLISFLRRRKQRVIRS